MISHLDVSFRTTPCWRSKGNQKKHPVLKFPYLKTPTPHLALLTPRPSRSSGSVAEGSRPGASKAPCASSAKRRSSWPTPLQTSDVLRLCLCVLLPTKLMAESLPKTNLLKYLCCNCLCFPGGFSFQAANSLTFQWYQLEDIHGHT